VTGPGPGTALHRELIDVRRDLHAHPELGFQEVRTAARVALQLRASGVEVTEGPWAGRA
jgi:metal-dependent amidase/aminoacylase/carboxypeptidase family protein